MRLRYADALRLKVKLSSTWHNCQVMAIMIAVFW